jgi:hypothetical protein
MGGQILGIKRTTPLSRHFVRCGRSGFTADVGKQPTQGGEITKSKKENYLEHVHDLTADKALRFVLHQMLAELT